jgi:hypothetical protein
MTATIVVRRVAATPARSAAEAWLVIADLVASRGSAARQELDRVAGIAMSLVAAEAMRDSPIVVQGAGPRLRVYCLYDDEAILGEGASEDPLSWCPTDSDWAMSLPCLPEDLSWVQAALSRISTRIIARDPTEAGSSDTTPGKARDDLGPVDVEAFLRR